VCVRDHHAAERVVARIVGAHKAARERSANHGDAEAAMRQGLIVVSHRGGVDAAAELLDELDRR
jgi:hypothetical protein